MGDVEWADCARNGNNGTNDDKHILGVQNTFRRFVSMDVDTFSKLAVHFESATGGQQRMGDDFMKGSRLYQDDRERVMDNNKGEDDV